MLSEIAEILRGAGLVGTVWQEEMRMLGTVTRLYRDYYDGKHRAKLTANMKKMLQIADDKLDRYNDNYCEMVVDKLVDRLQLEGVKTAGAEAAQAWADGILTVNRIDALQMAVHEATVRDGLAFVMVQYRDTGAAVLALETLWDGVTGIMPIWDTTGEKLIAAVKVWNEGDITRANIYYPNRTEKYVVDAGTVKQVATDDTTRDGQEPGIPLVAFANRGRGTSELTNVIPLQDSLNRTLTSMVMSAELTAFSLLFAVGFEPAAGLTPGMVISAMIKNDRGEQIVTENRDEAEAYAALMNSYRMERIEAGDLSQLINQAEFLIGQIGTVSSTPLPSQMGGDSQSGEALKQRESGLIGKAQRAQVIFGNGWEDVLMLAHRQQTVFGTDLPPAVEGFTAKWKTAEIRNNTDIRETAKLLHEWGFEREALRVLSQSSTVAYSEADITRLLEEKAQDASAALGAMAGSVPGIELMLS